MALASAVGVARGLSCLFVALQRVVARREARATSPAPVRHGPLKRHCIDLRQLLEEMPRASSTALRAAGIDIDQRVPDAALWVWGDAEQCGACSRTSCAWSAMPCRAAACCGYWRAPRGRRPR